MFTTVNIESSCVVRKEKNVKFVKSNLILITSAFSNYIPISKVSVSYAHHIYLYICLINAYFVLKAVSQSISYQFHIKAVKANVKHLYWYFILNMSLFNSILLCQNCNIIYSFVFQLSVHIIINIPYMAMVGNQHKPLTG